MRINIFKWPVNYRYTKEKMNNYSLKMKIYKSNLKISRRLMKINFKISPLTNITKIWYIKLKNPRWFKIKFYEKIFCKINSLKINWYIQLLNWVIIGHREKIAITTMKYIIINKTNSTMEWTGRHFKMKIAIILYNLKLSRVLMLIFRGWMKIELNLLK